MKKAEYFWTFPVRGLKITNQRLHLPVRLQFSDAGILSVEQCQKLIRSVQWEGNFDSKSVYEMVIRKEIFDHQVDSVILVRRTITKPGKENLEKLRISAEIRAREVCAVLMVLLAHISELQIYCGFPDELRHLGEDNFGFSLDARDFQGHKSWKDKICATEALPYSSAMLEKKILRFKWMKGLTRIILDRDSHFKGEVAESVRRALGRISQGLYAHTNEDYVLASQTAIEILLSHDGGKESDLKGRIKGLLLNSEDYDRKIDMLFDLRNQWVHRGKLITDEQGKESLDIGIAVVLAFANLAARLPAKTSSTELMKCLDMSKHRLRKSDLPIFVGELKRSASLRDKYC